jgi:hypothetical protein
VFIYYGNRNKEAVISHFIGYYYSAAARLRHRHRPTKKPAFFAFDDYYYDDSADQKIKTHPYIDKATKLQNNNQHET